MDGGGDIWICHHDYSFPIGGVDGESWKRQEYERMKSAHRRGSERDGKREKHSK